MITSTASFFVAIMTGLLAGSTLTFLIIKSYQAAAIATLGAVLNLGILIILVLR